nr:MAG TPA: hypothetical protein [Caudoviricetes sp.]
MLGSYLRSLSTTRDSGVQHVLLLHGRRSNLSCIIEATRTEPHQQVLSGSLVDRITSKESLSQAQSNGQDHSHRHSSLSRQAEALQKLDDSEHSRDSGERSNIHTSPNYSIPGALSGMMYIFSSQAMSLCHITPKF